MLLLRANQSVSAEHLALALWGDDAPPGAVKTVQVHVSRLRKALGDPEALVTTPGGYGFACGPGELDVERFERHLEDGRAALAAGHRRWLRPRCTRRWRSGADRRWRRSPRGRSRHPRSLGWKSGAWLPGARVEADLARAPRRAGRELQHVTSEHPWRERLHGQLMLALYRSGTAGGGARGVQGARRVLVDELGIEPGRSLRELEQAILEQDPTARSRPDDRDGSGVAGRLRRP